MQCLLYVDNNIGNPTTYYNGGTDTDKYTFTWQNGRELATSEKNDIVTTYKYGADGLRISKSGYEFYYSDGLLVRQIWADGEQLDFLYDESGTPYAMQYYSTMYYYVKNLQGDVVAIADANGNIVVNYVYDAWGNILSITDGSGNDISNNTWHIGNLNPIRYRSYYYDTETGFYYLQSRYYDPAIRRFINADGYVNANGDILGFNMYAYCGNNPVMYVDYTGEISKAAVIIIAIVTQGAIFATVITICELASPSQEEHYGRNEYNLNPSNDELQNIVDINSEEWYAVDDKYHRFTNGVQGEEAKYNKKYQTLDERNEVIICYDATYVPVPYIVTDPNNIGTYNYGPGKNINHFLKDVYPYWKWGNSPADTTEWYERIMGN